MAFPEPEPGFVVRHDYRRTHEAAAGCDRGRDRPAWLVAASDSRTGPRFVLLLPITRMWPVGDTIGIEIPTKVKQAIGLDDARNWVIISEHTVDEWPNAGLSPVPGKPGTFGYGFIPPGLFAPIKAGFLELARQNKSGAARHCSRVQMRDTRCGAKIRSGGACRAHAVRGKKRCRMHGGAPGSGAPGGNRNARKHGLFTREAIAERKRIQELLGEARKLLQEMK